jgi:hypothetical protein
MYERLTMIEQLILLPFVLGAWLLAWLMRFTPRHRIKGYLRVIVPILVGIAAIGFHTAEMMVYKRATGRTILKDDMVFAFAIFAQSMVALWIILQSESVVRRRENNLNTLP